MDKLTKLSKPTNISQIKKTNEIVDKVNQLVDQVITDTERTKLNGIESGANKTIVDSTLSSTSTNPVQNKAVNAALSNKVTKKSTDDTNELLNSLSAGTSDPTDEDYYIAQYAGGGTTTTTYHRRPTKCLANYIKGKLAKVASSGKYSDLSEAPFSLPANGGTSTASEYPAGFNSRPKTTTWGNQDGTLVTDWQTSAGGDIQFRDADGVLNVITDGAFYQKEGKKQVLDTDDKFLYVGSSTPPNSMPTNSLWIKPDEKETFANLLDYIKWNTSGAGFHNSIFRGKYLGSSVSTAQSAAIAAGTFDDLFIGDYWTINNKNYVIADIDYYYGTGDTSCTKHHLVVIPESPLYNAQMNESNITTGAYVGSKMYTTNLDEAKSIITNAFGASHLLTIRQYFKNATNSSYGFETSGIWTDATIWLMNETNVYGSDKWRSHYRTNIWGSEYTIDTSQYNYFRMLKWKQNPARWWYWLRDVVSAAGFAGVGGSGGCDYNGSSGSLGVRPAFLVI